MCQIVTQNGRQATRLRYTRYPRAPSRDLRGRAHLSEQEATGGGGGKEDVGVSTRDSGGVRGEVVAKEAARIGGGGAIARVVDGGRRAGELVVAGEERAHAL